MSKNIIKLSTSIKQIRNMAKSLKISTSSIKKKPSVRLSTSIQQ